jgi:hypothetical protein
MFLSMTSPEWMSVFHLYQRTLAAGVWEYLQQRAKVKIRRGIYAAQVVLWLMIVQRLQANGTLASAVQLLVQGVADELLPDCARVRKRQISVRTGAYCRARQKLPTVLFQQVSQEMLHRLREVLVEGVEASPRPVLLLDGSSLELEHSPELVRAYPSAQNQHGRGHWPILRVVVAHDLETGLAERPWWGPMYGPRAVSEQELAEQAMDALPAGAVVMGDRNFGIFWIGYAAQQRDLGVVLRLTEERARKLMGSALRAGDYPVEWEASRWDGGKQRHFPSDAAVAGRLVVVRLGRGKAAEWLYLFTTLDWNAERLVELYGKRWHIETDLRSLKRTVRLHHIAVQSETMMEKELLIAIAAYNLVRAVMCLAARRHQLDPRQLSFTGVWNVVNAAWPKLIAARTEEEHHQEFRRVLAFAAQCKLPQRRKRRSYPRAVWRRHSGFPFRKDGEK